MTRSSNASIEQLFISSVLNTRDKDNAMGYDFTRNDFRGYGDEWQWIINYFQRYRKLPSVTAFKAAYPNFPHRRSARGETRHYGDELQRRVIERELQGVMQEAAESIRDGELDAAIKKLAERALSVGAKRGLTNDSDLITSPDDVMAELESIYERADEDGTAGIPMGFPSYDENTGGAKPGELITVAARLGVGKSWILTKWATEAARAKCVVGYSSLEMPRMQVWSRMIPLLHQEGGVLINNIDLIKGKNYRPDDLRLFQKNLEAKLKGRVHISDRSRASVTVTSIAAQIERIEPDIFFIDYIQLMSRTKSWDEVEQISGGLKDLAMRYGIPIVVASQANREAAGMASKGEPPGPEHLANSDAIGRDSDTVVSAAMLSEHVMNMRCPKNRHGKSDFRWKTHFDPGAGIFKQISHTEAVRLVQDDKIAKQNAELAEGNYDDDENDDDY